METLIALLLAINLWKGLAGVALLLGGYWMLATRPPFKSVRLARAVAFALYVSTITGALLLIGQFWPIISEFVTETTAFLRSLF